MHLTRLSWLLPAATLTLAQLAAVLMGASTPLLVALVLATPLAWLAFDRFERARAAPAPAALLADEQRLMAGLREFVGREVSGTHDEIERTGTLVRAAVADLARSFAEMEGESRAQRATITGMIEADRLAEGGSPGMRQFAAASGKLIGELTGLLADSSRQSVVTVGKIDTMAAHLDAMFTLLDSLRASGDAAVAALDARLRECATGAREAVGGVRAMVEQTAEKEMDASVEAKVKADALAEQLERTNRTLADGIRAVAASGRRIQDSVGTAVRSLQFEDIAGQALTAANVHLERLQAINRDATQLQNVLTAANVTPDARMQAMEDFLRHIKEVRDSWVKPAHKPVAQVDLKSGTVELF